MSKTLKPIAIEDDCAPDALEYFKLRLMLAFNINFEEIKSADNICGQSDDDEICYKHSGCILYQTAHSPYWELYDIEDVKKSSSHLKKFV